MDFELPLGKSVRCHNIGMICRLVIPKRIRDRVRAVAAAELACRTRSRVFGCCDLISVSSGYTCTGRRLTCAGRSMASRCWQRMCSDRIRRAARCSPDARRNKVKLLTWERSGFVLWYKRLERDKFHWPRRAAEAVLTLTVEELNLLLDGYDVWRMKPHEVPHFSVFS